MRGLLFLTLQIACPPLGISTRIPGLPELLLSLASLHVRIAWTLVLPTLDAMEWIWMLVVVLSAGSSWIKLVWPTLRLQMASSMQFSLTDAPLQLVSALSISLSSMHGCCYIMQYWMSFWVLPSTNASFFFFICRDTKWVQHVPYCWDSASTIFAL